MRNAVLATLLVMSSGCATGGDGGSGDSGGSRMDGAAREDASVRPRDASRPRDSRIVLPDTGMGGDSGLAGACNSTNEGRPCDADRDGCTMGDRCMGGVCVPGPRNACDDGMACTTDRCISTGPTTFRCESEMATAVCTIGGDCHANGSTNPSNACQRCDSARSMSSWTVNPGAPCDDGDSCTSGDMCQADGMCTGTGSGDTWEPNEMRTTAHNLGRVSDRDSFPSGTIRPTLYPAGDEDWFVYHDSDDFGGLIYPRVDLENVPMGQDYDLCAYFRCDSSLNSVGCESGRSSTFDGLPGCCSAAPGSANESVRLNPDCSGTNDSGTVFVRVWRFSGPPVCATYTLKYGDD